MLFLNGWDTAMAGEKMASCKGLNSPSDDDGEDSNTTS